ncbi:MAG: VWA domain-containing protein [Candidatus Angelobacter sp.]
MLILLTLAGHLCAAVPQQTASANESKDEPVSIGLIIDNSTSMKDKIKATVAALRELVQASNPRDEFFVVNFNGDVRLDQDFTVDTSRVYKAIDQADAHGGTSLYDALLASGNYLKKTSKYTKKFLIVVTDGSDNESHVTSSNVLKEFNVANSPIVYCVGLFTEESDARGHTVLEKLAKGTGGSAFFPDKPKKLQEIMVKIAAEIRNR